MILVDVYIPSVDETYDFMLDENVEVNKVILEICEIIAKKVQNGVVEHMERFLLYYMTSGKLLDKRRTLASSGVKDGSRLMLL